MDSSTVTGKTHTLRVREQNCRRRPSVSLTLLFFDTAELQIVSREGMYFREFGWGASGFDRS